MYIVYMKNPILSNCHTGKHKTGRSGPFYVESPKGLHSLHFDCIRSLVRLLDTEGHFVTFAEIVEIAVGDVALVEEQVPVLRLLVVGSDEPESLVGHYFLDYTGHRFGLKV